MMGNPLKEAAVNVWSDFTGQMKFLKDDFLDLIGVKPYPPFTTADIERQKAAAQRLKDNPVTASDIVDLTIKMATLNLPDPQTTKKTTPQQAVTNNSGLIIGLSLIAFVALIVRR